MRLTVLFTSILIHWIAPDDRSAPIDNSAASRPSSLRMSRDINMRSLSINRGARLSQPAPPLFEGAFYETESSAASDATGYSCQKMSSVPTDPDGAARSGDASTLPDARAAPSDILGREASCSYASTSMEETTIAESSSSADGEHLRWPRPTLMRRPGEVLWVSYSALLARYPVDEGTEMYGWQGN